MAAGVLGLAILLPAGPASAGPETSASPDPHSPRARARDRPFAPGELLVRFRSGTSGAERRSVRSRNGLKRLERLPIPGLERVRVPGAAALPRLAARLTRDPNVLYAEPDYRVFPHGVPDDPEFDGLWGLHNDGQTGGTADADIDAPEGWDLAADTSGLVVAVIDTGIEIEHPDLADRIWSNEDEVPDNGVDDDDNGYVDDVRGWDFFHGDATVFDDPDDDTHGTHVAGTIAATMNNATAVAGVSQATIMPLKFLGPDGGFVSDAVEAIDYAIDNGAHVTNNSWGGEDSTQSLQDAIERANAAGQLFVAAAGNGGKDTDVSSSYPSSYESDNVVSVAATDHNDALAGFSNFGATTVDLGAPGVSILSTVPGAGSATERLSGTSMAAPHVAGAAAQLIARFPSLGPLEVKQRLMVTGDPTPALTAKTVSGNRLNLAAALNGEISPPAVTIDRPSPSQMVARANGLAVNGTATDDGVVTDVLVAIEDPQGRSWDGGTFRSGSPVWWPADLSPGEGPEVSWSFAWEPLPKADWERFAIRARARDGLGNLSDPESVEVTVDNVAPRQVVTQAGYRYQRDRSFRVTWDAQDGSMDAVPLGFRVARRGARFDGGWGPWRLWRDTTGSVGTAAANADFRGLPGATYCFRTTARDAAGNENRGRRDCTSVPLNNTHLGHRGRWVKRTGREGHYLESFSVTKARRARLIRRGIVAKRLAIVVTRCPRCGSIAVRWRGKTIRRIDLRASRTRRSQVIGIRSFRRAHRGTLVVVVRSRRRYVIVEGLGISRV